MYKKMLVPMDGSKIAEMVIPYAEEFAAKLGSEMILVSVFEPVLKDPERLHQTYLERISEQVRHQLKGWEPRKR